MDWDIATLQDKGEYGSLGALAAGGPCWFSDMPFSLVGDTLFLPFDLPNRNKDHTNSEPKSPVDSERLLRP